MSTRVSVSSAAPEQRRLSGVNSGGVSVTSLASNSPNNTGGVGGDNENNNNNNNNNSNPNNNNSGINNNNNSGMNDNNMNTRPGLKNGRAVSGIPRLTTNSSKMHKAEALARFHPKMITAQIISLQCFQYLAQSILIQINYLLLTLPASVDRIFTDKYIHLWRREGWADCLMILFSALFGAIGLVLIVEKSKKCLDFTVTYFILHLLLTYTYGGFPSTFDWWIVHILELLIMVILGEYLCSLKELEMIPLLAI